MIAKGFPKDEEGAFWNPSLGNVEQLNWIRSRWGTINRAEQKHCGFSNNTGSIVENNYSGCYDFKKKSFRIALHEFVFVYKLVEGFLCIFWNWRAYTKLLYSYNFVNNVSLAPEGKKHLSCLCKASWSMQLFKKDIHLYCFRGKREDCESRSQSLLQSFRVCFTRALKILQHI